MPSTITGHPFGEVLDQEFRQASWFVRWFTCQWSWSWSIVARRLSLAMRCFLGDAQQWSSILKMSLCFPVLFAYHTVQVEWAVHQIDSWWFVTFVGSSNAFLLSTACITENRWSPNFWYRRLYANCWSNMMRNCTPPSVCKGRQKLQGNSMILVDFHGFSQEFTVYMLFQSSNSSSKVGIFRILSNTFNIQLQQHSELIIKNHQKSKKVDQTTCHKWS